MNKIFLKFPITVGIIIIIAAICFGGWVLLDKVTDPFFDQDGSRISYQDEARAATMKQPVVYIGAETCGQCHETTMDEWLHSSHNTVICENCHGAGIVHGEEDLLSMNTSVDLCLNCHIKLASRPDTFPQISVDEHSFGLLCIQCHYPMRPEVDSAPQIGHAITESMACLDCHGEQSYRSVPINHAQRPLESCLLCHGQEKQL